MSYGNAREVSEASMIDTLLWKKIASCWIDIRTEADKRKTSMVVSELLGDVAYGGQLERSLVDVLLSGLDEEDDDGY